MVNVHYKHLPDVLCLELGVKIPRSDFVLWAFFINQLDFSFSVKWVINWLLHIIFSIDYADIFENSLEKAISDENGKWDLLFICLPLPIQTLNSLGAETISQPSLNPHSALHIMKFH